MNKIGEAAKSSGIGMTMLGVTCIILGMLCMLMPAIAGVSVAVVVGVLVVAAGFVRMFWAFKAGGIGKGILVFLIGVLTVLGGVMLLANPLLTTGLLTILLAVYFVVDGIFEIAAGAGLRSQGGSGWLIFGGIVSILLGIMIWRQFPLSGLWAIGVLFGIKLFFIGLIMLTGGSALRAVGKQVEGA